MSTDLIDPQKHRQLFLDSRALVSEQSTTRTLHPPQKCGPCITGDSLRAKYEWKHSYDLVFEKPVRLKFYLHQARLYAYWLEDRRVG